MKKSILLTLITLLFFAEGLHAQYHEGLLIGKRLPYVMEQMQADTNYHYGATIRKQAETTYNILYDTKHYNYALGARFFFKNDTCYQIRIYAGRDILLLMVTQLDKQFIKKGQYSWVDKDGHFKVSLLVTTESMTATIDKL